MERFEDRMAALAEKARWPDAGSNVSLSEWAEATDALTDALHDSLPALLELVAAAREAVEAFRTPDQRVSTLGAMLEDLAAALARVDTEGGP